MITPMRKYAFVVFHRDYAAFLRTVQDLGVVHVVEKKTAGEDAEVQALAARAAGLARAIRVLAARTPPEGTVARLAGTAAEILAAVTELQGEDARLVQAATLVDKEIAVLKPWGDFSPETIARLAGSGLAVRFLVVAAKKFDAGWTEKYDVAVVGRSASQVFLAAFVRAGETLPALAGAEEARLPVRGLAAARAERETLVRERAAVVAALDALAAGDARGVLAAELARVLGEGDYTRAALSAESGADDTVRILSGWVPQDLEEQVRSATEKFGVVTLVANPEPGEDVPVKLKNNRFAKLFEPITKLFALPGYAELDLTPLFAPFFMLFFGLCMGDAGYGALITLGCIAGRFFAKPAWKPFLTLGTFFGLATVAVGVMTGTLFGVSLVEVPALREFILIPEQGTLFTIALAFGFLQILFGMFVQIVNRTRQYGFLYALPTVGWVIILLSLVCLAGADMVGPVAAEIGQYTVFVGIALILFFNDLKANIFVRLGKGVWELYNITSFFGDILSYVRLFALGISGGILGAVINQISAQFESIPVVGPVLFIVALIIGHTGNILLSMLGAFVHPMRLTFVEFYKNAGFTGGGKAYKPLSTGK